VTAGALGRYAVLLLPLLVIAAFWIMAAADRRKAGAEAPPPFLRRNGIAIAFYLILAVGLWAVVMIVLPQLYMVEFSFHPKLPPTEMGGPKDIYTLENYRYFIYGSTTRTDSLNYIHLKAFYLTILVSIVVTLVNFALCYPVAFYMAQTATMARVRVLMLLLIVPYWINEILRAFAFRVIFGQSGVLNATLRSLGVIEAPIDFMGQDIALYTGLSYAYLLLMVFPLYNAIEALDRNQIEAARDLGAPWWHIHLFVVMPFAKPGIASGCTLVFMLSAGSLAAPLILGGPRSLWFTPIVYDRFYQAFNWPQGAAYAFILLLTCIAFVLLMLRLFKLSLGEITR
jgi:spermidine/putrescine transport system permease protein